MTLVDPNSWIPLAEELVLLRESGESAGDAIRMVFGSHKPGLLFLKKAICEAHNITSRDATRLIAKEISVRR